MPLSDIIALIAGDNLLTANHAADALARRRGEVLHIAQIEISFICSSNDRSRQRMLACAFQTGGKTQQFIVIDATRPF